MKVDGANHRDLLLRAALLQGVDAMDAWRRWSAAVELQQIDHDSFLLLPLLHHNLERQGVDDPHMGKLLGTYRRTWYRNRRLLHHLADALRRLHDLSIRSALLGGAALAPTYYQDLGLRSMEDSALLVRPQHAPAARAALEELGWTARPRRTGTAAPNLTAVRFQGADGWQLDLRWDTPLDGFLSTGDPWDAYGSMEIEGIRTHRLGATDQLLQLCLEGARRVPPPSPLWPADATMVLQRAGDEIDWDWLARRAREQRLVLPLRESIGYLRDVLEAPVPSQLLSRLESDPISRLERLQYGEAPPLSGSVPALCFSYWRLTSGACLPGRLIGLPGYLRTSLGLKDRRQLPLHLLRRGTQKLWVVASEGKTD
ncbi:MAG: nucleotidyltransferase family protein [Chloroflexota bacterium]